QPPVGLVPHIQISVHVSHVVYLLTPSTWGAYRGTKNPRTASGTGVFSQVSALCAAFQSLGACPWRSGRPGPHGRVHGPSQKSHAGAGTSRTRAGRFGPA